VPRRRRSRFFLRLTQPSLIAGCKYSPHPTGWANVWRAYGACSEESYSVFSRRRSSAAAWGRRAPRRETR